jgi:hypothetical protein
MGNRLSKGALLAPVATSPILRRGIERIEGKSPQAVDVLHGRAQDDPLLSAYDWVVALGEIASETGNELEDDAWAVAVEHEAPSRVSIAAATERARLYALYHVADCLELCRPVSEWAARRTPLLRARYALTTAGNVWSDVCRPDWFSRDIEDLPGLGLNGVLMSFTPMQGASIGRQTLPLSLTEDGVEVDRFKLPAFLQMFDWIRSFGLDIALKHQAFIPPQFTMEQVREHYDGRASVPGLEEAIEETSHGLAAALFTHMPQVGGLLFHSLECEWFWGKAVSMFPRRDEEACGRAFEAYLRGMTRACEEHGKTLMFWTHVSGIPARQIRLMHEILERHPDVLVVEDHKWQNNTWPHSPVMGHLAEDIRRGVTSRRWGMSIVTTDGEYYGAGALPTAYPEPNVLAAKTAVELGAECAFVRLNGQALTPLRTLDDVNAVNVIAASEQWWEPARPADEVWLDWCERRFGATAAPAVVSALKKSETIITKGLSAGRQPLIDHSGLSVGCWRPGADNRAWGLFSRPGGLLVEKPWDELTCEEMRPWQVGARGVELDDFLRDSAEAETAAREALRDIESVRRDLTTEDAEYLKSCFEDALLMMEAIRRAAVGARAAVLCLQEPGGERRRALEEACAQMDACADAIEAERGTDFRSTHHFMKLQYQSRRYDGYGVPIALRALAEQYREAAAGATR